MIKETFLKYLTKQDLLPLIPNTTEKIKKSSEEEIKKLILKNLKSKKITAAKIRKTWTLSLQNMFFDVYQKAFHITPSKKFDTTTKIKNAFQKSMDSVIQDSELTSYSIYTAKISSKPLHYAILLTFEKVTDFNSFLLIPLKKQIMLSIFPELGLSIYWPPNKDKSHKILTEALSSTFENVSEVKINALFLRKYTTQETITKLVISTPQEIAGFAGLDVIEFRGPNVVIGLSGLKRRHDANVDVITRVGPFTEIESESINLICGKGLKIKNYDGINPLLKVLKL
ncbi:MAG: hypothetical protein KAJ72_04260 [Candidatus Heimdallarchaeota archaeon]|nr:hypothetical protein [Candidatus Heimdallarchaeota archaeon]